MRIELVYAPGCSTYKKSLHILETVIAEERLPIPVELVNDGEGSPVIRINGKSFGSSNHSHEHILDSINASWKELTAPAL